MSYSYLFSHTYLAKGTQYDYCTDGDVRLIGGDTMNDGNVQLCYNNAWGSICDANWGNNDSNVICYQLGLQPFGKYSVCVYNGILIFQ